MERTDFSTFRSQEKDDSELTIRYQNMDDVYNSALSGRSNQYDNIERGVRQAVERAQSGINVSYDNSTVRTSGKSRRQAAAQAPKANNNASHQAWLAQQEAAKEAERLRRELERLRKEMEYQRKYNEAVKRGYQQTESKYARLHANTDYKANEGFDKMLNTRPKGTERIQSGHITAQPVSTSEIVSVIQRRPRHGNTIVITGTETSSLGKDWHSDVLANTAKYEEMLRTESEWHRTWVRKDSIDKKYWKEVETLLDGGQESYLKYIMKKNGDPYPIALGVNKDGEFVFCSEDTKKIYALSKDGSLLKEYTFDEKTWKDNNIYARINEDGLGKVMDDSYSVTFNESGKADLTEKDLDGLAPQFKTTVQMSFIDNGTSYSENQYVIPQSVTLSSGLGVTHVKSSGWKVSGGGKAEAEGYAGVSYTHPEISMKGDATASIIEGKVSVAPVEKVVRIGNKYYLTRFNVTATGGVGVSASGEMKVSADGVKMKVQRSVIPFYGGVESEMVFFKDITPDFSSVEKDRYFR